MAGTKKVILFTNSYPYGNGYNWLDSEIEMLTTHFSEVKILPYSYERNRMAKKLPNYTNVEIHEPLLDDDIKSSIIYDWRYIFSSRLFFYLRELVFERVYSSSYWFKSWLQAIKRTEFLLSSDRFKYLVFQPQKEQTVLYFYWGNNQSLLVPFLRKYGYSKILVRFHGFDLYKERLGGYQPFRRPLLRAVSVAAPISEFGSIYLKNEYSDIVFQTRTLRLGVRDVGRASKSNDGWFRIVSCASIIKLKRIDLIPKILKRLPYNIEWTHLGDGNNQAEVENEIKNLPEHLRVNLLGRLQSDEVQKYYCDHPIDMFISLSSTEGIPVSIMEALAAGIPVFSTDVGGIREIIDDSVGHLVDKDATENELVQLLKVFIDKYIENPEKYKSQAYQRFQKMCDQRQCNRLLLEEISS